MCVFCPLCTFVEGKGVVYEPEDDVSVAPNVSADSGGLKPVCSISCLSDFGEIFTYTADNL